MDPHPPPPSNVKQVVPLFAVSSMEQSIRFYVDGLGFQITEEWVVEGKLRWCSLRLGGAELMLQEFPKEGHDSWKPTGPVGEGVTTHFACEDALAIYVGLIKNGIRVATPFVGNHYWVTTMKDPDSYRIVFESPTDEPEGTEYTEREV